MDLDLFQPDEIPSQEGERTLICSCPKCSAKIELGLTQIFEDAPPNICPACKARYVLTRESFARRATRKAGEINCIHCGGQLDHSQYCLTCKALYPDYFVAEFPDSAKKRARQSRDLFGWIKNFSFEWRKSSTSSVDYQPVLMDSEAWQEPVGWKKKNIVIGVSAVVLVALVALGMTAYSHSKARKQYAESYIMALYGIKLGTDLGLKTCGKISADWTAKSSSGQSAPPQISVDEENQLNKVKTLIDKHLEKLGNPPTVFADSNDKLLKLNGVFTKLHSAAMKPSGTATSFTVLTQNAANDFTVTSNDLKKNLPTELLKPLEVIKLKYSTMKDF